MTEKLKTDRYEWLNKRTPRSVEQLRLWAENPRLNPENEHITIMDFVEDIISENADKTDFLNLVRAIAEDGFIPCDPIIVWQNENNNKYYVAEGNRRILALKILLDPTKAPKQIRSTVRKLSSLRDRTEFEKIYVNVSPSFEDAEWYINQRNNASSLQRSWSRIQQQRWINNLYEKYNGNIEKVSSVSKMTVSELESFIRILKIKDYIEIPFVKGLFTKDEYTKAKSIRFPITILERFFSTKEVRDKWGIQFDGIDVKLSANEKSFHYAFSELIKRIINNNIEPDLKIDTRTITTNIEGIIESLPNVELSNTGTNVNTDQTAPYQELETISENHEEKLSEPTKGENANKNNGQALIEQKNNPERKSIVLSIYEISCDSYRITDLFNELKKIPFKYINSISASLRVFLDLAVHNYIEAEGLSDELKRTYKADLKDIALKYRIEYLKQNIFKGQVNKIAERLINPSSEFSLDVLNGYIHSNNTHYLDKKFLNRFWDSLFPLFEFLLEIKEKS